MPKSKSSIAGADLARKRWEGVSLEERKRVTSNAGKASAAKFTKVEMAEKMKQVRAGKLDKKG